MATSSVANAKTADPAPLFLYIPLGILLNTGGVFLNDALNLPLFLDSTGTLLAAVVLGPWLGAATGFVSNLIIGLMVTPISIPPSASLTRPLG